MSSKVLNRRIKISRAGRPYVEVADLVRARLARIEKARQVMRETLLRNGSDEPKDKREDKDQSGGLVAAG